MTLTPRLMINCAKFDVCIPSNLKGVKADVGNFCDLLAKFLTNGKLRTVIQDLNNAFFGQCNVSRKQRVAVMQQ